VAFAAEAFKPVKGAEAASGRGAAYGGPQVFAKSRREDQQTERGYLQDRRCTRYFEYEVPLVLTSGDCAEGNSKPGGFVNP
jgi:hypothetical protein